MYKRFFVDLIDGSPDRINQELFAPLSLWIMENRIIGKQNKLETEDDWVMGKETIIYFQTLGFGWVLDTMKLAQMNLCNFSDQVIINSSLIKIIENILAENQRF